MSGPTDHEYFKGRAKDCRARAEAATNASVADIHRRLAANYDELVAITPDRPRGRIDTTVPMPAEL